MIIKACTTALLLVITYSAPASETVPGDQARKNGFRTCQKTVENLAQFITGNNKHASFSTWSKKSADTHIFNSQITVNYSDANVVSVLNVAPTKSGKCDSTYTTVGHFEKSCAALRETIFSDWKFSGELGSLVMLENKSGVINTVLLPSENGCTTIKTEVIHE